MLGLPTKFLYTTSIVENKGQPVATSIGVEVGEMQEEPPHLPVVMRIKGRHLDQFNNKIKALSEVSVVDVATLEGSDSQILTVQFSGYLLGELNKSVMEVVDFLEHKANAINWEDVASLRYEINKILPLDVERAVKQARRSNAPTSRDPAQHFKHTNRFAPDDDTRSDTIGPPPRI